MLFRSILQLPLVLVFLCSFFIISYSQKCDYEKNEIDDMTDKREVIMKFERLTKSLVLTHQMVSCKKVEGLLGIRFRRTDTSSSFAIDNDDKIIIKFSDNEKITLLNTKSSVSERVDIPKSISYWYADYLVLPTQEELDHLRTKSIEKIRFYFSNEYHDLEVAKKRKNVLSDQIKCIEKS